VQSAYTGGREGAVSANCADFSGAFWLVLMSAAICCCCSDQGLSRCRHCRQQAHRSSEGRSGLDPLSSEDDAPPSPGTASFSEL